MEVGKATHPVEWDGGGPMAGIEEQHCHPAIIKLSTLLKVSLIAVHKLALRKFRCKHISDGELGGKGGNEQVKGSRPCWPWTRALTARAMKEASRWCIFGVGSSTLQYFRRKSESDYAADGIGRSMRDDVKNTNDA